jgi:hypothetical protein
MPSILEIAKVAFLALLLPLAVAGSFYTSGWVQRSKAGPIARFIFGSFFVVFGAAGAYTTYHGLSEGSIHCLGRHCSYYYQLGNDPASFWVATLIWYFICLFLISFGLGVIRSAFLGPRNEP